jgi:hypothetical protein
MNQDNKKRNLLLYTVDTDDLLQRYETLRSHVLQSPGFDKKSGGGGEQMGYVLFLHRGMLMWMENCNTYILGPEVPEVKTHSQLTNNNYSEFPDPLKKQIVFALTNIILSHQRRIHEGK